MGAHGVFYGVVIAIGLVCCGPIAPTRPEQDSARDTLAARLAMTQQAQRELTQLDTLWAPMQALLNDTDALLCNDATMHPCTAPAPGEALRRVRSAAQTAAEGLLHTRQHAQEITAFTVSNLPGLVPYTLDVALQEAGDTLILWEQTLDTSARRCVLKSVRRADAITATLYFYDDATGEPPVVCRAHHTPHLASLSCEPFRLVAGPIEVQIDPLQVRRDRGALCVRARLALRDPARGVISVNLGADDCSADTSHAD